MLKAIVLAVLALVAGIFVAVLRELSGSAWRGAKRERKARLGWLPLGEVQVHGVVERSEALLVAPLTSRACVQFDALVEGRTGTNGAWETIAEVTRSVPFDVRDGKHTIRVMAERFHRCHPSTRAIEVMQTLPPPVAELVVRDYRGAQRYCDEYRVTETIVVPGSVAFVRLRVNGKRPLRYDVLSVDHMTWPSTDEDSPLLGIATILFALVLAAIYFVVRVY